ncbi:Protein ltv1 [Coniosporium tulheliwenetii]|uniref:Protein ltv1 n=1 Tax=Coniosporium tulheliwenetii TaxID=3383036 RepID=A0ACC2Z6V8_9PEZI|nr:Protein ltv1 [Cladosporium sp. JES 115]
MPRRKFINKKTATSFQLVHRAQNDPRINDDSAPDMVFKEVDAPNAHKPSSSTSDISSSSSSKIKHRDDLEAEFGLAVRDNEGEAANHGVFFDDTEYDYMQHMRDIATSTDAYWVEAPAAQKSRKGKQVRLEDALESLALGDSAAQSEAGLSTASTRSSAADFFGPDLAESEFVRKRTYQDQQDVPDALAGFQPDMDPRLREVLEALEDEAYVDDEDDIFAELAKDGEEVERNEWEEGAWEGEEDEGWESDDTVKPEKEMKDKQGEEVSAGGVALPQAQETGGTSSDYGDGDWMAEFSKFKKDVKAAKPPKGGLAPSELQSSIQTGMSSLAGGRRKKRKGAMTSTSGYSMSSSALFRTENQTLLDDRFDKIEEEYADDGYEADDTASMVSGVSGLSKVSGVSGLSTASSQAPQLRSDFDNIMDDFLGGYSMSGKRRVKKADTRRVWSSWTR